jgi:tRNA dimethylallyltransferase
MLYALCDLCGENEIMEKPKIVPIVGPTASGKSSLAIHLAQRFKGEIINADSVQMYRGLDIGTAKPSIQERKLVPHHLIDILDPEENYSAADFRRQADELIQRLHQQKIRIFVVGGTGLYLKVLTRGIFVGPAGDPEIRKALQIRQKKEDQLALYQELQDLDPLAASQLHPRDTFRIIRALEVYYLSGKPISTFQKNHGFREKPYDVLKIGLFFDRNELDRRIEERVNQMLQMGWIDEVRSLLSEGIQRNWKPMQSIGYRTIISHLLGEVSYPEAVRLIQRDTRRYAKRQMTWFRADPQIRWFQASSQEYPVIEKTVADFYRDAGPGAAKPQPKGN